MCGSTVGLLINKVFPQIILSNLVISVFAALTWNHFHSKISDKCSKSPLTKM